jgi:hypothetical protein
VRDLLHSGAPQSTGPATRAPTFDHADRRGARHRRDEPSAAPLYGKAFADTCSSDLPILYLYAPALDLRRHEPQLQGFTPVADGMLRLNRVSLAK